MLGKVWEAQFPQKLDDYKKQFMFLRRVVVQAMLVQILADIGE